MNDQGASLDKYGLQQKYGPLLTLSQVAEVLHRSRDGLRVSLYRDTELSNALKQAKKTMGRRVYFKAVDIAGLIDTL